MSLSKSLDPAADEVRGEQVAALRQAAVDYVARATGLSLDGSEESLAIVDHYVATVRAGGLVKPDVLRLIAAALGVYLGELLTSRFGGRWRQLPTSDEAQAEYGALAGWRIDLEVAPLRVDPIGMAAEALSFSEDDEADEESDGGTGFALLDSAQPLFAALSEALSRLAPVSSEYFYSLTGRFETLSYIVELVTDLRQQEAAQRAVSDGDHQAAAAPEPPRPR
jgi:hypothetical protein